MKIDIEISKDEMNASIYLTPSGWPSVKYQEIMKELADRGVVYGIDENKVKTIV